MKLCQNRDSQVFAVKIYRDPDSLEQAKNEFEILNSLKGNSLFVQLVDDEFYHDSMRRESYIVTEYLHNHKILIDFAKDIKPDEAQARYIF